VKGIVYLVGAGPGDAGLLTIRGAELLGRADVVVYDALVNADLLRLAPRGAEIIYGGKRAREHAIPQENLNALLVAKAREGKIVVRLKGGDPYVFGRGGEEAEVKVVVTGGADGIAHTWQGDSGALIAASEKHSGSISSLAISPENSLVASCSGDEVLLWSTQTGKLLSRRRADFGHLTEIQISGSGRNLLTHEQTRHNDCTLRLWHVDSSGQATNPFLSLRAVTLAQFSPDERWIATADQNGLVQTLETAFGSKMFPPITPGSPRSSARGSP